LACSRCWPARSLRFAPAAVTSSRADAFVGLTRCPRCREWVDEANPPTWTIVVAVCFFPLGLIAPFAIKQPTVCSRCGYRFEA
jgi:hypothetical protein